MICMGLWGGDTYRIVGNYHWCQILQLPLNPLEENFMVLNFAPVLQQDHTYH